VFWLFGVTTSANTIPKQLKRWQQHDLLIGSSSTDAQILADNSQPAETIHDTT